MPLTRSLPALVAAFALLAVGCEEPTATNNGGGHVEHDHDHDHDHHDHNMGPHGGHVLQLEDTGYQAEWIHEDEEGIITVHILDADSKPAMAYSADFVTVVGENTKKYLLGAVNPDNDGMASEFTLTDPELVTALKMAEQSEEAVKAELVAGLPNGEVRAKIEVHDHAH